MKAISSRTLGVALGSKSIQMETFTLEIFLETKNMGKGNFTGSAFLLPSTKRQNMLSFMKVSGGAVFQMEKVLIKNKQEIFMMGSSKTV